MIITVSIILFLAAAVLLIEAWCGTSFFLYATISGCLIAVGVLNITDTVTHLRETVAIFMCTDAILLTLNFGRSAIAVARRNATRSSSEDALGALLLMLVFWTGAGLQLAAVL